MDDAQIKAKAGKFFLFGNKMKLLGACLLLIVVGIFCGFVISGFIGAFDTSFCADPAWLRLFFWTAICVFTFPILGLVIWSRTGQTLKSLGIIIVVFMLVSGITYLTARSRYGMM